MRYIHAILLLHSSNQKIDEGSLTRVLEAAGGDVNKSRIKVILETLSQVDIDEAIKTMTLPVTSVVKKVEEKKEEEEETTFKGFDELFK